ncbi:MAG: secretin N-terminal domain-containing protein [Pirellulales bacterium]
MTGTTFATGHPWANGLRRTFLWTASCLLAVSGMAVSSASAQAADPAFVGLVALALEPEVAQQLKLDPEVVGKLEKLADERETAALELALEIKNLPADERAARLKPFVAESERLGLAELTAEQRTRLAQLRIFRGGLATLGEDEIAEQVGLRPEQRAEIGKLLQSRSAELAKGTSQERDQARLRYERELAGKLTREQRTAWDRLAGLAAGKPAATSTAKVPAAGDEKTTPATPSEGRNPRTRTPAGKPAAGDTSEAEEMPRPGSTGPAGEKKLKFNFRFAPWKEVLDWFATQADLSLILDAPPPGTFNYTDSRTYTPEEAIDLINGVLLTKGYVLVRRERLVLLLNLEDELPDPLVELVTPEQLDQRGRFELVRCLFPIKKLTPEDAEKEISKLIGPQGKVMTLAQSRQLLIRETAGRLRVIRDLIAAVEDPDANRNDKLTVIQLKHMTTDELLAAARPLLGIPENINSMPDGTLRISPDAAGSRLLVSGKSEWVAKLEEIATLLDVPSAKSAESKMVEEPQLEIYPCGGADPNAVLQVMQTLLAGQTEVRLAIDPKTGNLVALATLQQHATIRVTLAQMQKDASDVEVFALRRVDPQIVMVAINKLYGGDEKTSGAGAPKVESDPAARQLFVRGTPAQIAQVRSLLEKMGESDTSPAAEEVTDRGMVRTYPLTGRNAENLLQQLETIWPNVRPNRIRIVRTSGDGGPSAFKVRRLGDDETESPAGNREPAMTPEMLEMRQLLGPDFPLDSLRGLLPRERLRRPAEAAPPAEGTRPSTPALPPRTKPALPAKPPEAGDKPTTPPAAPSAPATPRNAARERNPWLQLVAWQNPGSGTPPAPPAPPAATPTPPAAPGTPPAPPPGTEGQPETPTVKPVEVRPPSKKYIPPIRARETKKGDSSSEEGAEVVISVQSGGITIVSRDTEALDAIDSLIAQLSEGAMGSGKEFTVFYLKYASAPAAGALVQEILAGGGDTGASGGGGGGGSLLGDLASTMMGDMGGGLLGGLLGGGGGGGGASALTSGGPISITSDARLNALFVRASAMDLELIEELLRLIDREASPENVQLSAPARFIPVFNTSAEEVATVVRQVYANRLAADANQARQPSPEDFLRALRGGGGRGGQGNRQEAKSEPAKATIGVDSRSNSLIVSAPEPLFLEIKAMVEQLDEAAEANRDETMRVVTLKSANPQLVQRALSSITAGKAKPSTTTTTPGAAGAPAPGGAAPAGGFQPQQMQDEIRRRIEAFNSQQGGGGGFPGGGFPGGGFPGGGFPGGGGGRGGFGGRGGRGGGR